VRKAKKRVLDLVGKGGWEPPLLTGLTKIGSYGFNYVATTQRLLSLFFAQPFVTHSSVTTIYLYTYTHHKLVKDAKQSQ